LFHDVGMLVQRYGEHDPCRGTMLFHRQPANPQDMSTPLAVLEFKNVADDFFPMTPAVGIWWKKLIDVEEREPVPEPFIERDRGSGKAGELRHQMRPQLQARLERSLLYFRATGHVLREAGIIKEISRRRGWRTLSKPLLEVPTAFLTQSSDGRHVS